MITIKRALISVSNKEGVVDLARALSGMDVEIISSGGSARALEDAAIAVKRIPDITGFPEMMDGRVKTLHPIIHGGILADRERHLHDLEKMNITPIDLVAVNLYPFRETVKRTDDRDEIIENIDIGGPTLIRAAAKNHRHVAVLVSPSDYAPIIRELGESGGISRETAEALAHRAFRHTYQYDMAIYRYFERSSGPGKSHFPEYLTLDYRKVQSLRYGENPHQGSAVYQDMDTDEEGILTGRKLQGKELSYNNILDFDAALSVVRDFDEPTVVIMKHTNPCGLATAGNICEAYKLALSADPMSAFGGVIGVNREVDAHMAREFVGSFKEGIIAPSFSDEARSILAKKKKVRLIEVGRMAMVPGEMDFTKIVGGMLLQNANDVYIDESKLEVVSDRKPTDREWAALRYGWKVIKHIKSNAIIFVNENMTVGIGAGQMSRVDAVRVAAMKAGGNGRGCVMASDAFFPFRDGIDEAHKAGITAVIQPGGSIRDKEVLDTVNDYGMAMVYTRMRQFKH